MLAEGLAPASLARYGVAEGAARTLARFEGRVLEGALLQHPFQDRMVPVILGEHVTLEAGTGAVHTAPAHGLDDYNIPGPPLQPAGAESGADRWPFQARRCRWSAA